MSKQYVEVNIVNGDVMASNGLLIGSVSSLQVVKLDKDPIKQAIDLKSYRGRTLLH